MKDISNINQDFEFNYACEEAKREFQGCVEGLLELHSLISSRKSSATERGKDLIFFSPGELEVYQDWLMNSVTSLLEHYATIDRVNRVAMKLYRISRIAEPKNQKAA